MSLSAAVPLRSHARPSLGVLHATWSYQVHMISTTRACALACALGTGAAASADFSSLSWTLGQFGADGVPGDFMPVGVTYDMLGPAAVGGTGSLTSQQMQLTGGNIGVRGITGYFATASFTGTVSVNWTFSSVDDPQYDAVGYVRNNQFLVVGNAGGTSGVMTFGVTAGETFGLAVITSDGTFGAGTATFTSFSYVPAPGAIAMLGVAGVAGRRRRGR